MASECNLTSYESVETIHVSNVLFAVPKKGRLYDKCLGLLAGAGMQYTRPNRLDIAECTNMPVTLVFLPAADIATYVAEGNVDIGITGLDVVNEAEADVNQLMGLGFGKCKLCVLAPVSSNVSDAKTLVGKRIVTSFPNLARDYFASGDVSGEGDGEKKSEPTHIKYVSGSVEAACGLGLADAVVDLVETGTTMKAAGLEVSERPLISLRLVSYFVSLCLVPLRRDSFRLSIPRFVSFLSLRLDTASFQFLHHFVLLPLFRVSLLHRFVLLRFASLFPASLRLNSCIASFCFTLFRVSLPASIRFDLCIALFRSLYRFFRFWDRVASFILYFLFCSCS
jgi:ATP phosphoribosyltransferase